MMAYQNPRVCIRAAIIRMCRAYPDAASSQVALYLGCNPRLVSSVRDDYGLPRRAHPPKIQPSPKPIPKPLQQRAKQRKRVVKETPTPVLSTALCFQSLLSLSAGCMAVSSEERRANKQSVGHNWRPIMATTLHCGTPSTVSCG